MSNKVLTIPNGLTLIRFLVLYPVVRALVQIQPWWFLFWVSIGIVSDFLDGYIARRFNQKSDVGRIADPIIDKLNVLVVSAYMVYSADYHFPLWFFIFILCRELIVMLGSLTVIRKKHVVMESNRPGKNSAFATGIAVLLSGLRLQPYAIIVVWIAFVLTCYSTYAYVRHYLKYSRKAHRDGEQET